jgi:D-alanine-D-alanine ligase
MLVAILHNAVADDAPADERDVLVQADAVSSALQKLGHEAVAIPVTLDLQQLSDRLKQLKPAITFYHVEALCGTDRLSPAVPILLVAISLPYTGNDGDALHITNSKRLTKERLTAVGVPTPPAVYIERGTPEVIGSVREMFPGRFLIKAVHEHASFGMDDGAVITAASQTELLEAIRDRSDRFGKPFFAERFIDGREFNLSVLDSGDGSPDVLPHAEITFETFPPDKPRIVGYAAKWDDASFEYHQTPRRFAFPKEDGPLLKRLTDLAATTWEMLRLRGYARVDFRVDEQGRPYVIEANANPCLSPDAGFAAALQHAGIPFEEAVRRILEAAFSRPPSCVSEP